MLLSAMFLASCEMSMIVMTAIVVAAKAAATIEIARWLLLSQLFSAAC